MPLTLLLRERVAPPRNPRLITIGNKLQVLVLLRPEAAKVIEQMLDRLLEDLTGPS